MHMVEKKTKIELPIELALGVPGPVIKNEVPEAPKP